MPLQRPGKKSLSGLLPITGGSARKDMGQEEEKIQGVERRTMRNRNKRNAKRKRKIVSKEQKRKDKTEQQRKRSDNIRRTKVKGQVSRAEEEPWLGSAAIEENAEHFPTEDKRERPLLRLIQSMEPHGETEEHSRGELAPKKRKMDGGDSEQAQNHTKKRRRLSKVQKQPKALPPKPVTVCKFYINGACKRDDCQFSHEVEQVRKTEVCRFFKTGTSTLIVLAVQHVFLINFCILSCRYMLKRGQLPVLA